MPTRGEHFERRLRTLMLDILGVEADCLAAPTIEGRHPVTTHAVDGRLKTEFLREDRARVSRKQRNCCNAGRRARDTEDIEISEAAELLRNRRRPCAHRRARAFPCDPQPLTTKVSGNRARAATPPGASPMKLAMRLA